jgi:2,4-dienoyl-CoA reductase-like NADH-dependent reductase (Old Yellow Enzyme family)
MECSYVKGQLSRSESLSLLHAPITFRKVEFRNRIWVSPMCQYSSHDGLPTDWHLVHLGARATGGAGAVMVEATAVTPEGRISPGDSGIWADAHTEAFRRITAFLSEHGAVPGIQIGHAGRKASNAAPWLGGAALGPDEGGWQPVAPSAVAFDDGWHVPRELTEAEIATTVEAFAAAAHRSYMAGFQLLELHAAHGYLLHEFLSPLSNFRTDGYGGDFAGRTRLTLEVVEAVRAAWPADLPLAVRLSASDWVDGGWSIDDSVALSRLLGSLGVDLVDCSSGGLSPAQRIAIGPGFQVPFAAAVRRDAEIATAAVGQITEPEQAEAILQAYEADVVLIGRESLRDPSWPLRAASELGEESIAWPQQYERARPSIPAASSPRSRVSARTATSPLHAGRGAG